MEELNRNNKLLLAPRSFPIFLIHVFGLCPLCTVIILLFIVIASGVHFNSKDIFYLSTICLPFLLISFFMLYFPQKYRYRLIVDQNEGILKKSKKGQPAETYDINSIKGLTSKRIITIPGGQYKLILEKHDGSSSVLFYEDTPYKGSHWERFSDRVADAIGRPLEKEIWVEDDNGKLSLISPETLVSSKRKGMWFLAILASVSFLGAASFRISISAKTFFFIGLITVLTNIVISFYYVFRHRDQFGKWGYHNLLLVGAVLTLVIPYSIFYVLFVFALFGFQFPSIF